MTGQQDEPTSGEAKGCPSVAHPHREIVLEEGVEVDGVQNELPGLGLEWPGTLRMSSSMISFG